MKKLLLALLPFLLFAQQSLSADTLTFTNSSGFDVTTSSCLSNSVTVSSGSVLKVSGILNFAPDPSVVSMYQASTFGEDHGVFNPKQVLHVEAGAMLIIGDAETGVSGELRVTANTFLFIEDGAGLLIEDGSSLVVEEGGAIVIQSGVDVTFMGTSAFIMDPCVMHCLQPEIHALSERMHDIDCPPSLIIVDICDNPWLPPINPPVNPPNPPQPPQPPVDPYPSMVADNDLEFVNTLVGIVGTTPTGALTYTIPITVPVGTAGMTPQLAIVYNSQNNSNGILGLGFGLSGLSSISRIGRNFYHDNERTGVTLTMNDHFALDGQRLIRIGGSEVIGTDGVIYDTEMASFSEIRSFGHGGNHLGPQRFEIRTKDGRTLHYGTTVGSITQHTTSSQTVVSQWQVSRVEDANGNFMEYWYHDNLGGWANQIRQISYTGHTSGITPYNRIVFTYIDRPAQDRRTLYLAGHPINNHKLLNEIQVFSEGRIVKIYRFQYTTDWQRLVYMRKFVPYGNTERIVGELRFDWSEPQQRFADPVRWTTGFGSSPNSGSWQESRHLRMLADVNGDGRADIVGFGEYNVYVALSSGATFSAASQWVTGNLTIGSGGWYRDRHSRHAVDVNGDGIADIVGFGYHGVSVGLSNGNNRFSLNGWTLAFGGRDSWDNVRVHPRHLADFNGDGLPDIIAHAYWATVISLNTGNNFNGGWIQTEEFSARHWRFGEGSISLVGDINGDGRADMMVLRRHEAVGNQKRYSISFALSNGTSLGNPVPFRQATDLMPFNRRFNSFLQDVNGDGMADLIFTGRNGLYVALATGTGFLLPQPWTTNYGSNTPYSSDPRFVLMMADVNGDGMADIIAFDGTSVRVSLSTGTGFAPEQNWTPTSTYWGSTQPRWNNENNFRTMADVNGDGLPDLIGFDNYGVMVSLNMSGQPLLIGVRDNLGRIFTAEYDFLTNSEIYTRGTDPVAFPLMNFQGPLRVCTRLTTRSSDKRFTYEGAVIHKQGRGFLGFSRDTVTNYTLQLKQVSEFELNTDFFVKLPRRTQVFSTVNDQLLSENIQTNAIRHLGGRRILNEVTQTISRDFLTGVQQTTNLTYDGFGNVTSERTYRGLIGQNPQATFVTRNTYAASAGRAIPNRLQTSISYSYYIDTSSQRFSNTTQFSYDSRGNLTQRIDRHGTPIARTTSYVLNNRGLVIQITASADGVPPMVQTFGYDQRFRFQTSQTTVGLGTSRQTFNTWGQMLTQTSMGGQTTTYEHDAFGRLRRVTSPEGFVTTHTIRRERNTPGVVYTSFVEREGRPSVRSFLDILGRTVRTESPNPSGTVITRTEFNNRGQVTRTSMPHFANETPRWTTFAYDNFGRLISETFEGLTTTYTYSGLTTTITPPAGSAQATSRTHNAAGDLIRATDAGGAIYYQYFAPGFVNRITAPGNAVTTIEYDQFGRQTALHDPNAGRITFSYDAFDRIVSQTNARGYTTTNTFDALGRLSTVTEAGNRITTYAYIASGPNIGRLQSISVNNGTSHIFEYDEFGRITRFKDVSESNTFITEYTYDRFGNLATYTFPSGFTLHYTYDANSFKTHIRENNSAGRVIWQLGSVNALGQELSSTVLDRSKTQTYNVFGQPTRMTLQGLMDYTYTYDLRTGNMLSRRNIFNGQNETFTYDALNRLTTGVTFSPCGNILSKQGVGNFTYDPVRRHAVTRIDGTLNQRFDHNITYTSFQKISTITATNSPNLLNANFVYGPNRQRRQMTVLFGNNTLTKHYTQNFEQSIINGTAVETKEYIFSPFGLIAIRNNGQINAIATDHLGSIVARFNPRVGNYEHFGYTAWGKRYRYANGTRFFFNESPLNFANSTSILDYFARGFTGHEHMDAFGLINMNGRLYDPVIGRFLSPDPFVPDATFSQDFNRYMYARNNPLSYIDPDGEIVRLARNWISGFVSGFFSTSSNRLEAGWNTANQRAGNTIDIFRGLFQGSPGQVLSRFTWELPQTWLGYNFAHFSNFVGQVDRVDHWGGATVVSGRNFGMDNAAVALGSFIIGGRELKACPTNWLFQHEFGHYLQSQAFGWFYLQRVGLPSLFSSGNDNTHPVELDANRRAFRYFSNNVSGFNWVDEHGNHDSHWDRGRNPIPGFYWNRPFNDDANQAALRNLRLGLAWHDWMPIPTAPGTRSLINILRLNRNQ
ncbi:MAG: FG-GAP-like repeat-containing protein [Bacteroidales bacterium]|nr:FG-GAP-like repeat-containing protein [Bacteroidales bacterium]